MVTASEVVSPASTLTGPLGVSQSQDLGRVALEISAALGAPVIEDRTQLSQPGRSVLAIYREHGPARYGLLPTLSGVAFLDVTAVPEDALMRLTASLNQPDLHAISFDSSRLGCGLVVSDPATRKDHYGQAAEHQVCLDERKWAQDLFLKYQGSLPVEQKAERPAGWIFSVGQEGLIWNVESSNYLASISRRWFGGCKG